MSYRSASLGEVMIVNLTTGDDRVRALQRELARLGFLSSDASRAGIDGKWGPNTERALRQAAEYVGFSGTVFRRTNSRVTVPDDLLVLIRMAPVPGAAPAASPPGSTTTTPGGVEVTRRPDGSMSIGPLPSREDNVHPTAGRTSYLRWALGLGGGIALGVGIWMIARGATQIERERFGTRPTMLATNRRNRRAYRRR